MSLERFCYLVICREEANKMRRKFYFRHYRKGTAEHREHYSAISKEMRSIANKHLSPARKQCGAIVKYTASNCADVVTYWQGVELVSLSYEQIKDKAFSYVAECDIFYSGVQNPYAELVNKYENL